MLAGRMLPIPPPSPFPITHSAGGVPPPRGSGTDSPLTHRGRACRRERYVLGAKRRLGGRRPATGAETTSNVVELPVEPVNVRRLTDRDGEGDLVIAFPGGRDHLVEKLEHLFDAFPHTCGPPKLEFVEPFETIGRLHAPALTLELDGVLVQVADAVCGGADTVRPDFLLTGRHGRR